MKRFKWFVWIVTLFTTMFGGALPSQGVALPAPPQPLPQTRPPYVAAPCYGGTIPPIADPICMVFSVNDLPGNRQPGIRMKLSFGEASVELTTGAVMGQAADMPAAAFDVRRLGANLTDVVTVRLQQGGRPQTILVAAVPDARTRTQIVPSFVLGKPEELGLPMIWGTVDDMVTKERNIAGVEVGLWITPSDSPATLVMSTTTAATADHPAPFFGFNPPPGLANGDRLTIRAATGDDLKAVPFTWEKRQAYIPVVFGTSCLGVTPRGGGAWELPGFYCLKIQALRNGEFVKGATASISILDVPQQGMTDDVETEPEPTALFDIGPEMFNSTQATTVSISVLYENMVGLYETTLAELWQMSEWEQLIIVSLQNQLRTTSGLAGGIPAVIAGAGPNLYGTSSWGGLNIQTHADAEWSQLAGIGGGLLPIPEITAIAASARGAAPDRIVIGLADGSLWHSEDGGAAWDPIQKPANAPAGAIRALSEGQGGRYYWAAGDAVFSLQFDADGTPQTSQVQTSRAPVAALASDAQSLFVADEAGVVRMGQFGNSQVYTGTVHAIGLESSGPLSGSLLLGTPEGLVSLSLATGGQIALGLRAPVTSLARLSRDQPLWAAVTPAGIHTYAPASETVTLITYAESSAPWPRAGAGANWFGTPILYSVAVNGPVSLVGTSRGAAVSTNEGHSWTMSPLIQDTVRQVAFLGADYLALTARQLIVWNQRGANPIAGLPVPLNGAALAVASDGTIAVGAGAGPSSGVYIARAAGAAWQTLLVGNGRGVNAIVWLPTPQGAIRGFVATDDGGVFALTEAADFPTSGNYQLTPVPAAGERLRTLAVASAPCTLVAGSFAAAARVFTRSCDLATAWTAAPGLTGANGKVPTLVTDIDIAPNGRYYVTTSEGLLIGDPSRLEALGGLPLRPLAVGVAPNHSRSGQVMFGGVDGMLIFTDISPDLTVEITGPSTALGGAVVPLTVTVRNIGLLPAVGSHIWLELPPSLTAVGGLAVTAADFDLTATGTRVFTATVKVSDTTAPSIALIRAVAQGVTGERPIANNIYIHELELDYKPAPDTSVSFAGNFEVIPGQQSVFYLLPRNIGSLPDSGSRLRLTIPSGITIGTPMPAPSSGSSSTVLEWDIEALGADARRSIEVPYTLEASAGVSVLLHAEIAPTASAADRNPANNSLYASVRTLPAAPETLVVINRSRMVPASLEFIEALGEFTPLARSVELALDEEGPCEDENSNEIACLYAKWDAAVAALANEETPATKAGFLTTLGRLTSQIQALIDGRLRTYPKIKYIVFVGDDQVIPGVARSRATGSGLPESLYAAALGRREPLYGFAINNTYISDMPYEKAPTSARMIVSGRLIGTSQEMARALTAYNQSQRTGLKVGDASITGYAVGLTADIQRELCGRIYGAQSPLCANIAESPDLIPLAERSQLVGWSGHGDSWSVNQLTSAMARDTAIKQVNIIMLLACHTGIVPTRPVADREPLLRALTAHNQQGFAFTGYAMAVKNLDPNVDSVAISYAEELYYNLALELAIPASGELPTLGGALWRARAEYAGKRTNGQLGPTDLDMKTIESLRLYGLPNLKVHVSLPDDVAAPSAPEASGPAVMPNETMTIDVAWQSQEVADGTLFRADVAQAETVWLIQEGRTVQQAVEIVLPAGFTDVQWVHPDYHDIAGVDPVIPVIAALSDDLPYSEPPYEGGPHDWRHEVWVYTDSAGRRIARIALAEWHPQGDVQRLYDQIEIKLRR